MEPQEETKEETEGLENSDIFMDLLGFTRTRNIHGRSDYVQKTMMGLLLGEIPLTFDSHENFYLNEVALKAVFDGNEADDEESVERDLDLLRNYSLGHGNHAELVQKSKNIDAENLALAEKKQELIAYNRIFSSPDALEKMCRDIDATLDNAAWIAENIPDTVDCSTHAQYDEFLGKVNERIRLSINLSVNYPSDFAEATKREVAKIKKAANMLLGDNSDYFGKRDEERKLMIEAFDGLKALQKKAAEKRLPDIIVDIKKNWAMTELKMAQNDKALQGLLSREGSTEYAPEARREYYEEFKADPLSMKIYDAYSKAVEYSKALPAVKKDGAFFRKFRECLNEGSEKEYLIFGLVESVKKDCDDAYMVFNIRNLPKRKADGSALSLEELFGLPAKELSDVSPSLARSYDLNEVVNR